MADPPEPTGRPKRHVGVSKRRGRVFVKTKAGWIMRWRDPIDGKRKQVSMNPLGIDTAKERQLAAEQKSKELVS